MPRQASLVARAFVIAALGLLVGGAPHVPPPAGATSGPNTVYLPLLGDSMPLSITALASAMGAGGTYPIIGELRNYGTTAIIATTLTISADGETFTATPIFTATLPGGANYFMAGRTHSTPPVVLGAAVTAFTADHTGQYEPLTVVAMTPYPDYALGAVNGTIRNDGAAEVRQIQVLAVLRSPAGALLEAAPALQLSSATLAPGETATFYVPALGYRFHPTAVAEVHAQGLRAP